MSEQAAQVPGKQEGESLNEYVSMVQQNDSDTPFEFGPILQPMFAIVCWLWTAGWALAFLADGGVNGPRLGRDPSFIDLLGVSGVIAWWLGGLIPMILVYLVARITNAVEGLKKQ